MPPPVPVFPVLTCSNIIHIFWAVALRTKLQQIKCSSAEAEPDI